MNLTPEEIKTLTRFELLALLWVAYNSRNGKATVGSKQHKQALKIWSEASLDKQLRARGTFVPSDPSLYKE